MQRLTTTALLLLLLSACSIPREVSMVNYYDGISRTEASIMIERYLHNQGFCPACYSGPVIIDRSWAFWLESHSSRDGLAFDDVPPILIDMRDGLIRWDPPSDLQERWLSAASAASGPQLDGIVPPYHH